MNGTHYRGWRFSLSGTRANGEGAGLHLSAQGGVSMVEGRDSVRQAILLLLATAPGERVMRPEYGCSLHHLLFAPNDDTTAGLAIHYVRRALERWEPRIAVVSLDAGRSPTHPEQLDIALAYRVRATGRVEPLTLSLDLTGGGRHVADGTEPR